MDWENIHSGKLKRSEITLFIQDPDWQRVRRSMKGRSLEFKYNTLVDWLEENDHSHKSQVQVTNYINALKRGGLV